MPAPPPPRKQIHTGRNWLTEQEVKSLITSAKGASRNGHRDSTMLLLAFRHGMRCIEVVGLLWDQIHLDRAGIEMRRAKHGKPARYELTKAEIRALKKLSGARSHKGHVFTTAVGGALGERSFHLIVQRAGNRPAWDSRYILICCGIHAVITWRRRGWTREGFKTTWVIETSSTPFSIPKLAPGRFAGFFED